MNPAETCVISTYGPDSFTVGATAGEAVAHPPELTGAASEQRAEDLRKKGNALSREGRLAEAVEAYTSSLEISKTYAVTANLGSLELKLGQYRHAAEHLAFALRMSPPDAKPAVTEALNKALAEAKMQVGALEIHVTLDNADVAGGEVLVDGKSVGTAPLAGEVFVEPGAHVVEARLAGREGARREVTVAAGGSADVKLTLPETRVPPVSQPVRERPSVPVIVVGGSITVAAVVVGAVLAGIANGKGADANAKLTTLPVGAGQCQTFASTCGAIHSDLQTRDALSNASMGTFIGAGAIGVTTLLYALLPRKAQPAARVRVLPTVGSGHGGVAVVGAW